MAVPYRTYNIKTSRKEFCKDHTSKYIFFAWSLRRLVEFWVCKDAQCINSGYLTESIQKTDLLKGCDVPKEKVDAWLSEMALLGLIVIGQSPDPQHPFNVRLTEKGVEAYKNQTYQLAATTLINAERSEKLACTAIWVARIGIVLTLVTTVFSSLISSFFSFLFDLIK